MEKARSEELSHSGKTRRADTLGKGAPGFPSRVAGQGTYTIQAKLEATTPGDAFEEEADRVADKVVSGFSAGPSAPASGKSPSISAYGGTKAGIPHNMESQLSASQGGGMPLPSGLKSMMEGGFGRDLSSVRLHTDSTAAGMSDSINARAFTSGKDIYFNRGEYSPDTTEGQRLIAHEITHTLQQGAGLARKPKRLDDEWLAETLTDDILFWCRLIQPILHEETGVDVDMTDIIHMMQGIKKADKEYFTTRWGSINAALEDYPDKVIDTAKSYFSDNDWRFSLARHHAKILDAPAAQRYNFVAERYFRSMAAERKHRNNTFGYQHATSIDTIEECYFRYKAHRNEKIDIKIPDFMVSSSTWVKIFGIEMALVASVCGAAIGGATALSTVISMGIGTANDLLQLAVDYKTGTKEEREEIDNTISERLAAIAVTNIIGGGFIRIGSIIGDAELHTAIKVLLNTISSTTQQAINTGATAVATGDVETKDLKKSGVNIVSSGISGHGSAGASTVSTILPVAYDAYLKATDKKENEKEAKPASKVEDDPAYYGRRVLAEPAYSYFLILAAGR